MNAMYLRTCPLLLLGTLRLHHLLVRLEIHHLHVLLRNQRHRLDHGNLRHLHGRHHDLRLGLHLVRRLSS